MFNKDIYQLGKELEGLNSSMENPVDGDVYLIEEMSELTKELMKARRGKGSRDHIEEELADVYVTLLTYSIRTDINFNKIRDICMFKLKRGIERLKKGDN